MVTVAYGGLLVVDTTMMVTANEASQLHPADQNEWWHLYSQIRQDSNQILHDVFSHQQANYRRTNVTLQASYGCEKRQHVLQAGVQISEILQF